MEDLTVSTTPMLAKVLSSSPTLCCIIALFLPSVSAFSAPLPLSPEPLSALTLKQLSDGTYEINTTDSDPLTDQERALEAHIRP